MAQNLWQSQSICASLFKRVSKFQIHKNSQKISCTKIQILSFIPGATCDSGPTRVQDASVGALRYIYVG